MTHLRQQPSSISLGLTFVLSFVFAIAYTQLPLFSSNQNTYLLHGIANANIGLLKYDWLANTEDPFPIFSFIVTATQEYLHPYFFYLYYFVIQALFAFSVLGIVSKISNIDLNKTTYLTFFIVLAGTCSYVLYWISQQILGSSFNISKVFHFGLAEQYILGSVFQPSVFGVFLLTSVYAFLCQRPFVAVCLLGVACNLHPSYLLSGASLTIAYMILQARYDRSIKRSVGIGFASLVLVVPVVLYSYVNFAATSPEILKAAQDITINVRIPHHAIVSSWFSFDDCVKLTFILIAVYVLRREPIGTIIAVPFIIGLLLTALQMLTASSFLALLFPWRISAFLVPLSVYILIGKMISLGYGKAGNTFSGHQPLINICLVVMVVLLLILGLGSAYKRFQWNSTGEAVELQQFVSSQPQIRNTLYLVPPHLENFRLNAAVPTFVDYKSHPYKDTEVIEWYKQYQFSSELYATKGLTMGQCQLALETIQEYGITHIVKEQDNPQFPCLKLTEIYSNEIYSVHLIH